MKMPALSGIRALRSDIPGERPVPFRSRVRRAVAVMSPAKAATLKAGAKWPGSFVASAAHKKAAAA